MNSPNEKIKYRSESVEGPTALHAFAGLNRHRSIHKEKAQVAECLKLLVEAGGDVNASTTGDHKPLHYAVKSYDSSLWGGSDTEIEMTVTELLLQYGADPNVRCHAGATPLHKVSSSRPKIIEVLVKHGANVNAKNNHGSTALLSIINSYETKKSKATEETILKLLEHGAGKFQPPQIFSFCLLLTGGE